MHMLHITCIRLGYICSELSNKPLLYDTVHTVAGSTHCTLYSQSTANEAFGATKVLRVLEESCFIYAHTLLPDQPIACYL